MFLSTTSVGLKTNTLLTVVLFVCLIVSSTNSYSQGHSSNRASSLAQKQQAIHNFIWFFPDTTLATLVADRLQKIITDAVTAKELASIKGEFEVVSTVASLKGIGYLTGIESFNCYKNEVTELPAEVGKLKNLVSLDLCKAFSLAKIPPEIGNLKNLVYLRLALTEVKIIPRQIGKLTNLQTLLLCCNGITEIPKEIGDLRNLTELDIHSNEVGALPDEICNLTSLVSLDASYCGLKKLPANVGNLHNLQTLNLFGNDLKYLPHSIMQLDSLSYLNIYDNFKLSENYKHYLPPLLRKGKKK